MTVLDDLLAGSVSGFGQEAWAEAYRLAGAPPPADWRRDPAAWVRDALGEWPHVKQVDILESVRDNRYTAVPSAHEMGKSWVGSRTGAWWMDTAITAGLDCFLVSTAPSAAQVSAILWREIRKAQTAAKKQGRELPGHILRAGYPQWMVDGELMGYGRKPADYEESAFQGIHARDGVLVVIDEAGGIKAPLWDSIRSLVGNEKSRILAIGNPDDAASEFAKICRPQSGWNVIQLDGLRSPNMNRELCSRYPLVVELMLAYGIPFSTEPVPDVVRDGLAHPLWVDEMLRQWCGITPETANYEFTQGGRPQLHDYLRRRTTASALFQIKVRGEFSSANAAAVIPLGWINQAVARWKDWVAAGRPELPGRRVVGVDVAAEGDDETAIAVRQGWAIQELHRYVHADTEEVAGYVRPFIQWPQAIAVIDTVGVGTGVAAVLRHDRDDRHLHSASVASFNAGARDNRIDEHGVYKFRNNRSFMWWRFRELLDPSQEGGSHVMLPDDENLINELATPRYQLLSGVPLPVLVVEPKKEIKKRLRRSTDSADAVIQAFWVDGSPTGDDRDEGWAVPWGDSGDREGAGYAASWSTGGLD